MSGQALGDRRRIFGVKSATANFDLYDAGKHQEIYADGVANVTLGLAVAKMVFFKVRSVADATETDGPKLHEDREIVAEVTVPTNALIEAFISSLTNMWPQREQFLSSFDAQKQILAQLMNSLGALDKRDV